MPPFFGLFRKAAFYQKKRRKLQENHNELSEYSRQNAAIQTVPADPSFSL
jgi:hypothetical protein